MAFFHRRYFLLTISILLFTLFAGSSGKTAVLSAKQLGGVNLDTTSPSSLHSAQAPQMAASVLLFDGSFENDPSAWTEQDTTNCLPWIGDWTIYGAPAAYDGTQVFWGGGACGPVGNVEANSNSVEQVVAFQPIDTTLSFYYYLIRNERDSVTLDDYGYVAIDDTIVWDVDIIEANETNGWVNVMIDISDYAGQTVTLELGGINGPAPGLGHIFYDFIEIIQDEVSEPDILISKTPDYQEIGVMETAVFSIEVSNTGNVTLFDVEVTDAQTPSCGGLIGQLNVDSTVTVECEATNVSESFINNASVTGEDANGAVVFDNDTAIVELINPDITIVMTPNSQTIPSGGTATFDVTITNIGNVDLFNIVVSDPLVPDCNANFAQLSIGASQSYNPACSISNVTQSFLNSIFVTSEDADGTEAIDQSTAFVDVVDSGIAIAVNPAEQTVANDGDATFNVFVFNIGDAPLTDVEVSSAQINSCNHSIGNLAIGANVNFTCTASITAPLVNIVQVTGTNPIAGTPVQDSYAATVNMIDIDVDTVATPASMESPGGLVTIDVVLTNNGNKEITLDSISSTFYGNQADPQSSPLQNNSCLAGQTILADGGTFTCQFELNISSQAGDFNIVTDVSAFDVDDNEVADLDSAPIEITASPITTVYLPAILNNYVYGEPNDKCSEPFDINTNFTYQFLPDDENDWYLFETEGVSNLTIELTDFLPIDGQLLVYYGPCNAISLVGHNGDFSASKTITLNNQPAGDYRIWVLNAGSTTIGSTYTLKVTETP